MSDFEVQGMLECSAKSPQTTLQQSQLFPSNKDQLIINHQKLFQPEFRAWQKQIYPNYARGET